MTTLRQSTLCKGLALLVAALVLALVFVVALPPVAVQAADPPEAVQTAETPEATPAENLPEAAPAEDPPAAVQAEVPPTVTGFEAQPVANSPGEYTLRVTFNVSIDKSALLAHNAYIKLVSGATTLTIDANALLFNATWSGTPLESEVSCLTSLAAAGPLVAGNAYTVYLAGFAGIDSGYLAPLPETELGVIYLPVVTGLSATPDMLPNGGGSTTITLLGGGLPGTYHVGAFLAAGGAPAASPTATAVAGGGNAAGRTATLALPANTSSAPASYILQYSADGTTWVAPASPATVTVVPAARLDSMVVSKTDVAASGEAITVMLNGEFIPDDYLTGAFLGNAASPALTAQANGGTASQRTAQLTVPENTTFQAIVYTLKYSADGGASWLAPPAPLTLTQAAFDPDAPLLHTITVSPDTLNSKGGNFIVKIAGERLPETVTIVAYPEDGDIYHGYEANLSGLNPLKKSGTVSVPPNISENDVRYIVVATVKRGEALSGLSATLTVKKPSDYSPGGSIGTGSPATSGEGAPPRVSIDTDPVTRIPAITLSGGKQACPDVLLTNPVDYGEFTRSVEWNGLLLTEGEATDNSGQFGSHSGSTVVRLYAGFLRTQPSGVYRVRLWFNDGYADYLLRLRWDDDGVGVPQTGDASATALGFTAMGILAVVSLTAVYRRRSHKAGKSHQ